MMHFSFSQYSAALLEPTTCSEIITISKEAAILKWQLVFVDFILFVTSYVGLQEVEPQTAFPI